MASDDFHILQRSEAPLAELIGIKFELADPDELRRIAADRITKSSLNNKGLGVIHSVNSPFLGPSDRSGNSIEPSKCCNLINCVCDQQIGLIELAYPLYRYDYMDLIIQYLSCICWWTGRLLVPSTHPKFESLILNEAHDKQRLANLVDLSKNTICCCQDTKKRTKRIKIPGIAVNVSARESTTSQFENDVKQEIKEENKEEQKEMNEEDDLDDESIDNACCCGGIQFKYVTENLILYRVPKDSNNDGTLIRGKRIRVSQAQVLNLFQRIVPEDYWFMGANINSKPENLIHQVAVVSQLAGRLAMGFNHGTKKQRSENVYTRMLHNIVVLNQQLRKKRCEYIHVVRAESNSSEYNNQVSTEKKEIDYEPQLQNQNGQLIVVYGNRSGDPEIDDLTWAIHEPDIAFFEPTFFLINQLQYAYGSYIDEKIEVPKFPVDQKSVIRLGTSKQSINSSLRNRNNIVRQNILAKRVECSGRGVIIPDGELDVDELGVPVDVAMAITFPEPVTNLNIAFLQRLIRNGPKYYPGAKLVEIPAFTENETNLQSDDNISLISQEARKIDLKFCDRVQWSQELKVGMIVHRHLLTGDYVNFNRQPSLHKLSFMAHRARVRHGACYAMNPETCKSYGADFDGDACTFHRNQTLASDIESRRLLAIHTQITTPQNSSPLISPIQDIVLGCFQLTQSDIVMSDKDFYRYLGQTRYLPLARIGTHPPGFMYRTKSGTWNSLRSGKELFSQLLPNGFNYCKNQTLGAEHMSCKLVREPAKIFETTLNEEIQRLFQQNDLDQELIIIDQQLISGVVTSKHIGSSNTGLIHQILHRYGRRICLNFESDLRIINNWLADFGFSVGSDDCILPNYKELRKLIEDALSTLKNSELLNIQELPEDESLIVSSTSIFNGLEDPTTIARNQRDRAREVTTQSLLNQLSTFMNTQVQKSVKHWNRLWQMVASGSKGKGYNLLQIMLMLGQVELEGRRLPSSAQSSHFPRSGIKINPELSRFIPNDRLLARGFVLNCFNSGITPLELISHMKGGREGMISSTVNTCQSGYTNRCLTSAMSSMMIHDDGSVRDAAGNILQLQYGKDGFDATWLCPVDFYWLQWNDKKMDQEWNATKYVDQFPDISYDADGTKNSTKELLHEEFLNLLQYRDKLRQVRMHYNTIKFNTRFMLPLNPQHWIRQALKHQSDSKEQYEDTIQWPTLNPLLVIRLVRSCVERLYGYYSGFYNRQWALEASIYSTLSVKKVLIDYGLNYIGLEFLLGEIESCFQRALSHSKELVGPLSAQMVSEMYTQNMLNQHRVAGSSDAATQDSVNIDVFSECINLTQEPKNPQMKLYLVSMDRVLEFMSKDVLEKVVFHGKSFESLDENEQNGMLAQFVMNQIVSQSLSQLSLSIPVLVDHEHFKDDDEWYNDVWDMMDDDTKTKLNLHLKASHQLSIRLMINEDRLQELNISIQRIIRCIRRVLKDEEVFIVSSPILYAENRRYRVLRIIVSPQSEYYNRLNEGDHPTSTITGGTVEPPRRKKSKRSKPVTANSPHLILYTLMYAIHNRTQIHGVYGIEYACIEQSKIRTINHETGDIIDKAESVIITTGSNVMDTFSLPFIDDSRSSTSVLRETKNVWGIEVAANRLDRELTHVLESNGSHIDDRHLQQVSATMTHRGFFMAMRRQGINNVRDFGVLHRGSFEQLVETVKNAASTGEVDRLLGVTECQIVGKLLPIGTAAANTLVHPPDVDTFSDEIKASHIKWIQSQVLPNLNDLDKRIMLYNSGEERVESTIVNNFSSNENILSLHHSRESDKFRGGMKHVSLNQEIDNSDPIFNGESKGLWDDINEKRKLAQLSFQERLATRENRKRDLEPISEQPTKKVRREKDKNNKLKQVKSKIKFYFKLFNFKKRSLTTLNIAEKIIDDPIQFFFSLDV